MADVARLEEALDAPADGLVLVGRRHLRSNNSWMHNLPTLAKGPFRCTLQVHPDDAARFALADGGSARVRSKTGEVVAQVEITDCILPGVVCLPHGWGHDAQGVRMQVAAQRPGANSNLLADEFAMDPLSGTSVLNGIPVQVSPA
jgi:anaerobic selenocysteine-containing dehydrogenase